MRVILLVHTVFFPEYCFEKKEKSIHLEEQILEVNEDPNKKLEKNEKEKNKDKNLSKKSFKSPSNAYVCVFKKF